MTGAIFYAVGGCVHLLQEHSRVVYCHGSHSCHGDLPSFVHRSCVGSAPVCALLTVEWRAGGTSQLLLIYERFSAFMTHC